MCTAHPETSIGVGGEGKAGVGAECARIYPCVLEYAYASRRNNHEEHLGLAQKPQMCLIYLSPFGQHT